MKIGIFGGTFNPIHKSHLYIVDSFYKELELSKVILMPTYIPPHKEAPDLADAKHRLEMCRLACRKKPYIELSDFEIEKKGKSYTYETLEWLNGKYPESELFLIMGSDMFLTIEEWKNPQRIYELSTLCTMAREENEYSKLAEKQQEIDELGARSVILMMNPKPMSSTEIRGLISERKSVKKYLDSQVEKYIKSKGLYRWLDEY